MSTLFLIVCAVAVVFYVVVLIECSRPGHAAKKVSVRKLVPSGAVDSAGGRRFLVHLEKEMAEFVSVHHRAATMLLIGMLLLSIPLAAQGPIAQPPVSPSSVTDQQISPAVQRQLDAMQKSNEARSGRSFSSTWSSEPGDC
jgi:hypothetical protein